MQLKIYKIDGTESKESVELPSNIFDIEPNHHLIYQAVRNPGVKKAGELPGQEQQDHLFGLAAELFTVQGAMTIS